MNNTCFLVKHTYIFINKQKHKPQNEVRRRHSANIAEQLTGCCPRRKVSDNRTVNNATEMFVKIKVHTNENNEFSSIIYVHI